MLTIETLTHTAKESVEMAGEKHLESVVFHPEPRCYTDAVGCRKLFGKMIIHSAVKFVQLLFADASEYAEGVVSEVFRQLDCSAFSANPTLANNSKSLRDAEQEILQISFSPTYCLPIF